MATFSIWTIEGRKERGIEISTERLEILKLKRIRQLERLSKKYPKNKRFGIKAKFLKQDVQDEETKKSSEAS